jgi:outer membrane receptor protein involved in Fe transport
MTARYNSIAPALLLLAFSAVASWGQTEQATLVGTVSDTTGAVIPGATLVLREVESGTSFTTQANETGQYRIPYLKPGLYELVVEARGFKRTRVSDVRLTVGLVATVNATLEVGTVETEVTVVAPTVQIEAQTAALGSVVNATQITQLPLVGRSPYSLVALAPAVLPADNGTFAGRASIGGGRVMQTSIFVDGAQTRDPTAGNTTYAPPLEAVQEFKVLTNNFSPEFGQSPAGVITTAMRSGTNQLRGSVYEFLRNDKLNANGWTANRAGLSRTKYRWNNYGIAAGGPVFLPRVYDGRNRTFFYINWEAAPTRTPSNIRVTVPTTLERKGDFSATRLLSGDTIRIYDPTTTRPDPTRPGRYLRDPFPENRIPAGRISPISAKVLEYYPEPNRTTPTENFAVAASSREDTQRLFLRGDQNIGMRHRFYFTLGVNRTNAFTPGITLAFPGEGPNNEYSKWFSRSSLGVLSDTVTFSPSLVGQFRFTLSRAFNTSTPRSLGFDFTQLGLPAYLKAEARTLMFPRFEPGDVAALGPDRLSYRRLAQGNAGPQGHITWIRGVHALKFGGEYNLMINNTTRPNYAAGRYIFSRAFTQGPDPVTASASAGYGPATLLLGAPTGGQFNIDASMAASQKLYAWYIQDDWRLRPNLTVNVGIRYEYHTPYTDRFNQLAYFDPDAIEPVTKAKGALRFVGQDGGSRYPWDPDKNNFAPRIGLSWRLLNSTVVRAGYGLYFAPGNSSIGNNPSDFGSGFNTTTNVFLGQPPAAPNTPPTGASLADPFTTGLYKPPSDLLGGSLYTAFRNNPVPFNQQWNLSVQRMLPAGVLVETAYLGSRGEHLWFNRNQNAVSTEYLALGPALDELVPNPYFGQITTGSLSARTVRRSALLRPFSQFADVTRFRDPVGDSIYHAFTLRAAKETSNGLMLQGFYTISKLIDTTPELRWGRTSLSDPNNLRLSRSVSDNDRPQYLVISAVYQLPFGKGKRWTAGKWGSAILGGWQVSNITTFGKGQPVYITAPSNTGLPGVTARAIRLRSGVLSSGEQTLDRWFDTSAFLTPPPYTLGNDSRTQPDLRTPGIKNFDVGCGRYIGIRESLRLQVRGEFANAFNTPQFNDPVTGVNSRDFGRVLSARGARTIQVGLRLTY